MNNPSKTYIKIGGETYFLQATNLKFIASYDVTHPVLVKLRELFPETKLL